MMTHDAFYGAFEPGDFAVCQGHWSTKGGSTIVSTLHRVERRTKTKIVTRQCAPAVKNTSATERVWRVKNFAYALPWTLGDSGRLLRISPGNLDNVKEQYGYVEPARSPLETAAKASLSNLAAIQGLDVDVQRQIEQAAQPLVRALGAK